jgi:hypothetical protein
MDANETAQIINAAGGDVAFAKLIGIDGEPGHQQRVNNWKRRGMPAQVVLDHYPVIQRLRSEIQSHNPSTLDASVSNDEGQGGAGNGSPSSLRRAVGTA